MKNISIVYKRPKTIQQPEEKKQQSTNMRKTVNNYYTKMVEKGLSRDQMIQKIRVQTAKSNKIRDRKNVISSLSIASLTVPQSALLAKNNTQVKLTPTATIFNVKRPKLTTFFTLRLPEHNHDKHDHVLARKSTKQLQRHAKLKILTKIKNQKQATLVISVDFIFNQFSFWGEEQVEDNSYKTWKLLMPLANIIWIVRNESTSKKLISFAQTKNLRLDGVVQLESSKRESLTISFQALEQQMKFHRGHRLLIINSLRNCSNEINQFDFRSSLPLVSHPSTYVHFVHIDMNNKNRFVQIKKIVSKQPPQPFNLHEIFQDHKQKKGKYINHYKIKDYIQNYDQNKIIDVLDQMEKIKQNLLLSFQQSFGLKTKIDGDSLTYVVGDMIKRNYGIGKQFYRYFQQVEQRKENKETWLLQNCFENKLKKTEYNRPVYIWGS